MASSWNITDTSTSKLFKIKYDGLSRDFFNGADKFQGRVKRSYDLTGEDTYKPIPFGFAGGYGAGQLPAGNAGNYKRANIGTPKNVYVTAEVDRPTVKRAKNQGAFVDLMKQPVKEALKSFKRNQSRILFGDGSAELGTIDSLSSSGSVHTCVITAATFHLAKWEIRELVNLGTNTDLFEVTSITPSTRTVVFTKVSGSYVPVASDKVYPQGGLAAGEPIGLKGSVQKTTSTLYGIDVGYRWQSQQYAAAGAGIDVEKMVGGCMDAEKSSGVFVDTFVTSYTQMQKLLVLNEDKKIFQGGDMKSRYGDFSFSVVKFNAPNGEQIPFIADRFCEEDTFYGLYSSDIEMCFVPDTPGWADDEGSVWKQKQGADGYYAYYAAYQQNYIPPSAHFVITGLATA